MIKDNPNNLETSTSSAPSVTVTHTNMIDKIEKMFFSQQQQDSSRSESFSITGQETSILKFVKFPIQDPLIYLNDVEAYSLLMDPSPAVAEISQYSSDFFLITSGLDAQINTFYAGAASVAGILNSLRFLKNSGGNGVHIPIE